MSAAGPFLDVVASGPRTVVRLRQGDFPPEDLLPGLQGEFQRLAGGPNCRTIALDVGQIRVVRSAYLAMLLDLRHAGVAVELLNTTADLKEHLEITRLDQLLGVHDPDL